MTKNGTLFRGKRPRPIPVAALARLKFPDGSVLSASLRRWLAFDGSWLGWFTNPNKPVFRPKKLGQHAKDEYADDSPFLCVQYPGIDVYLAIHSGLIEYDGPYGSLADDPRFASRMKEHAKKNLGGARMIDLGYGHGQFANNAPD